MNDLFNLNLKYIKKREELDNLVATLGLKHKDVLKLSREVGRLAVRLQWRKIAG